MIFRYGRALAQSWKSPFFETSAFNRQNVDECFFELVREVRRHDARNEGSSGGGGSGVHQPKKTGSGGGFKASARGSLQNKGCTLL